MFREYTRDQLWKLYKDLPNELKETIFALETIDSIYDICSRNEIENAQGVAKGIGYVLLGVLSPADFQETLEKEVGLDKEVAKKVAREINRFIFYPVKSSLEEIYNVPITPPPAGPKVALSPEAAAPSEEKPTTLPTKDVYREPLE